MKYLRKYEMKSDIEETLEFIDDLQEKIKYLENQKRDYEKGVFPSLKEYLLFKNPKILDIKQPDIDEYEDTFKISNVAFYKNPDYYIVVNYWWNEPYSDEHTESKSLTKSQYEDFIFFANNPKLYDQKNKFNV